MPNRTKGNGATTAPFPFLPWSVLAQLQQCTIDVKELGAIHSSEQHCVSQQVFPGVCWAAITVPVWSVGSFCVGKAF